MSLHAFMYNKDVEWITHLLYHSHAAVMSASEDISAGLDYTPGIVSFHKAFIRHF